jgi:hypothetical protein
MTKPRIFPLLWIRSIPIADLTQTAALFAAGGSILATVIGGVNFAIPAFRERPKLTLYARQWSPDRFGNERYIDVDPQTGRAVTTRVQRDADFTDR